MKYQRYKSFKEYRLPGYDYSGEGSYFVTICTKNREEYFGKIENEEMGLSNIGRIVDKIWNQIPIKFPDVRLDVFQIMPDHFHGIVIIKDKSLKNLINQIPTNKIDMKNEFKSGLRNNPMELN